MGCDGQSLLRKLPDLPQEYGRNRGYRSCGNRYHWPDARSDLEIQTYPVPASDLALLTLSPSPIHTLHLDFKGGGAGVGPLR